MRKIEIVESFFKMPFKRVIEELHWDKNISINTLGKQCGVSRQTLSTIAKSMGLEIKSPLLAIETYPRRKEDHWAFGLTKKTSRVHKEHSERMKRKNPTHNIDAASRAAEGRAKLFRENPLPQEVIFCDVLKGLGVPFDFQYPFKQYVLDFFLPNKNLCIEIDSTAHWGTKRKLDAKKRDSALAACGIRTVRIDKRKLSQRDFILNILKTNNVI